jgi:hypothetical protein
VENCELGVFCAYATSRGRALIDRELYLPKSWTEHRYRCREAGVPGDVQFATKPELARMMLGKTLGSTPRSPGALSWHRKQPGQLANGCCGTRVRKRYRSLDTPRSWAHGGYACANLLKGSYL